MCAAQLGSASMRQPVLCCGLFSTSGHASARHPRPNSSAVVWERTSVGLGTTAKPPQRVPSGERSYLNTHMVSCKQGRGIHGQSCDWFGSAKVRDVV